MHLKKYDEAIKYYDMAIQSDPEWAYPWFWKGYTYYLLNNNQKALECANKALQLEPDYKDAKDLKDMIKKVK